MSLPETPHKFVILLRLAHVVEITKLPPSSVYAEMRNGDFPRPVALSANRVAWVESEVQTWIRDRIEKHRAHEQAMPPRGRRAPKSQQDNSRSERVKRRAQPGRVVRN